MPYFLNFQRYWVAVLPGHDHRHSVGITFGVGGVVVRGPDVLLVKRTYGYSKGLWSLPSGYVDFGESVNEALEREVMEETRVRAECRDLIFVRHLVSETKNDLFLVFRMTYREGTPRPDGEEISEARFLPLQDMRHSQAVAPLAKFVLENCNREGWRRLDFAPRVATDEYRDYLLFGPLKHK